MTEPRLACPRDHEPLVSFGESELVCSYDHRYSRDPVSAIPTVFDPLSPKPIHANFVDPLGRTPDQYEPLGPDDIDDFVQDQIAGTGGYLYERTTLKKYPSPVFPLAARTSSSWVLDVGAGWGRWSLAAAHRGWNVWAVDPWIDCCRSLNRVMEQQKTMRPVRVAQASGTRLPFAPAVFDAAFSYSVIQHLPKPDAHTVVAEMVRTVRPGGVVLIQMPNVAGIRQRLLQRRGVVCDENFSVRPWTMSELESLAEKHAPGAWRIFADGFFSLNAQWSERSSLRPSRRVIVGASEALRRSSKIVPALIKVADSVWIRLDVS